MTTGLQNVPTTAPAPLARRPSPRPLAFLFGAVAAPLVRTARALAPGPGQMNGVAHAATPPPRAAFDVRRGVRAAHLTSVRDVHDHAVMRGVFPPRV